MSVFCGSSEVTPMLLHNVFSYYSIIKQKRAWCPTLMFKDRWCWWRKWPKPSPTSNSCLQQISSPTSVTNIGVALLTCMWMHSNSICFCFYLLSISISIISRNHRNLISQVEYQVQRFKGKKLFCDQVPFKLRKSILDLSQGSMALE